MAKNIAILGSTGSIGTQALRVVDLNRDLKISALTAHSNIKLLEMQIRKYRPRVAAVADRKKAAELKLKVADLPVKVLSGDEGVTEAALVNGADTVLTAVVGISGLLPTLEAIKAGRTIALANKETLVAGGDIVVPLAHERGVSIIPVDSEHSAIFQCLQGHRGAISRIILTASGGPFYGWTRAQMKDVTARQALSHPSWRMGPKITIDSATLMNKGLEVIEAHHLFNVPPSRIEVLVHRQSFIHSMVEFEDFSVLAQMSPPDMALPISYALTYPDRRYCGTAKADFTSFSNLTFALPDRDAFPCLEMAYRALERGGTMPAVLNAANEEAVKLFLKGKIRFGDIPCLIEKALDGHNVSDRPSLADILAADAEGRARVHSISKG